jgi:hypothetical protein
VCIEDPFETSHDLGRTVGPNGADRLKGEFRQAWRVLREASSDIVERLFAPAPDDRALWDAPERRSGNGSARVSGGGGRAGGGSGRR